MPPPIGIPNRGSTCYANSVIQCIRASIGVDIPIDDIPPGPADAAEYLMTIMDRCPQIGREYEVGTKDGVHHILLALPDGRGMVKDITYYHDHIIVQRDPSPTRIKDIATLSIGGDTLSLVAMVCSIPGHYYAMVNDDGTWYICDDLSVSPIESITCTGSAQHYPVYMMFYRILESQ